MPKTTTVSMLDRAEEIREQEIPHRREMRRQIKEEAEEYEQAWKIPDKLVQRASELDEEIGLYEGRANKLEEYAEEWGDDVWVIRELSLGGVGQVQDDVAEASGINVEGEGTPKTGYMRKRTLEKAVQDSPPQAPGVGSLPEIVGEWLFDCVDEFNSKGEVDLGNSSLRAELMNSTE